MFYKLHFIYDMFSILYLIHKYILIYFMNFTYDSL